MSLSPAYAIFVRYWYLLLSTPQRLVQIFVWSALDIMLWGFVTVYLRDFESTFNFTTVFLGALIFWQIIARIQQGVIMVFLEDSWTRNFLNVFASPMTIAEYLLGIVVASLSTSVLSIASGFLIAGLLFGLNLPPLILPFLLFALILSLFAIMLGILSCAIVLRFGPTAEWFAWPIPAVVQPLVGVFYPIAVLPGWAQIIAQALPPTYAFENLRSILSGGSMELLGIGFALVLAVGYVALAGYIFARTYWWALKTGAISRFGSESF